MCPMSKKDMKPNNRELLGSLSFPATSTPIDTYKGNQSTMSGSFYGSAIWFS